MDPSKSTNFAAGLAALPNGSDFAVLVKSMLASAEMAVGEYTGTGAALDIATPFEPSFVVVYNMTDANTIGVAFKTTNGAGKSAVIDTLVAAATANQGILFTAGSKKFSLGTDAKLNVLNKVYQYVAFGV